MQLDQISLDDLYLSYNYEIKSGNHRSVRVYVQKFGIYNAAEIVPLTEGYNSSKLQKEYSNLGYATKIRNFSSINDVEDQLFKEYFLDSPFYQVNQRKYKLYVEKQVKLLPEGSKYEFLDVPYDYMIYENKGGLLSDGLEVSNGDKGVVHHIMDILNNNEKPVFVIVEAAAGFGKTCIAFEILKEFITNHKKLLPFFTELSKNRDARVFKHILINAIENYFPEGIKSSVVIKEIMKGKVPLIIDGFDELLSKDLSDETNSSINSGNMLSTIMELLNNNAKIAITSRKTALFDSEIFHEWAKSNKTDFVIARFFLKEPSIESWISKEKLKIFQKQEYRIEKLANPVLLTYLRNIKVEDLNEFIKRKDNSLFDYYFKSLLTREKIRQNLELDVEEQLMIFMYLAKFMVQLEFRSDDKEGIKDYLSEYSKEIILECIKRYESGERPTFSDVVETLSNHVLLDRKENDLIGFINDFVFGTMVANGLVSSIYKLKEKNAEIELGLENCKLAVQAYKINSTEQGMLLWDLFNKSNFQFDNYFYFEIDTIFTNKVNRPYSNLHLANSNFTNIIFDYHLLTDLNFINCIFTDCFFNADKFRGVVFQGCSFYNCQLKDDNNWSSSTIMEGSKSNNGFEKKVELKEETEEILFNSTEDSLIESQDILELFFERSSGAKRNRSLSQIENKFNTTTKDLRKVIKHLTSKGYLLRQGDMFFISRKGIDFFNNL